MKVNIISIGNSKGIRIPKAILQQCHIKQSVDFELENGHIVIKPYHKKPRKDWEQCFEKMHQDKDDRLFINDCLDLKIEDWVW